MFSKKIFISVFFFFTIGLCHAQKLDSLLLKSYDVLSDNIKKRDSLLSFLSAKAYLLKAKIDKDTIKIANGYYFLGNSIQENDIKKIEFLLLRYNDSIIHYTKNITTNKYYPSLAYLAKGDILYSNQEHQKALNYYLLALKTNNSDDRYLHYLYHRIGNMKLQFKEYKEALLLFKKIFNFNTTKEGFNLNSKHHLLIIFSLSDAYLKNTQLDSASYYYDLGYKKSLKLADKDFKIYFTLGKGVLEYYKKNYTASIDSLEKSIPILRLYNDIPNEAYAHFYLGKSTEKLGLSKKSFSHFKNVDSLFDVSNNLPRDLRETYPYLIKHYKKKKDYKNQLKYTEKLLILDSTYFNHFTYINEKIYKKIDRNFLLEEKKALQIILKKRNYWFTFVLLVSFLFFYINHKKRKKTTKIIYDLSHKSLKKKTTKIISSKIKNELLKKLKDFEEKRGYLNPEITVSSLSKQFNTNSRYLSNVINDYKFKNFTHYINDLRIIYVIDILNSNPLYKKYTIDALSKEAGFRSPESFSKSFLKKTSTLPSLYIKKLHS